MSEKISRLPPEVSGEFMEWLEIVRTPEPKHRLLNLLGITPSLDHPIPIINVDGLSRPEFHLLAGEYVRVHREIGEHIRKYRNEGNFATNTNAPDSLIRPRDRVWTMQVRNRAQREREQRHAAREE